MVKHDVTREILRNILTDEIALQYNFRGTLRENNRKNAFKNLRIWDLISSKAFSIILINKFNKHAIELKLITCIFSDAVVDGSYKSGDADDTLKGWLKQARKRINDAAAGANKKKAKSVSPEESQNIEREEENGEKQQESDTNQG